jgi:hypothetical protein
MVARRAHNPKVVGSNPAPATKQFQGISLIQLILFLFQSTDRGLIFSRQTSSYHKHLLHVRLIMALIKLTILYFLILNFS